MKRKAALIRKHAEEYAKTPEGRELTHRMIFAANPLKILRSKRMTRADFCRKINMESFQFSRIAQGDENITMAMITRIADGLGVPPTSFSRKSEKRRMPSRHRTL